MNEDYRLIWAKLVEQGDLLPGEQALLRQSVANDGDVVAELYEDRVIDSLLHLMSESEQQVDQFCHRCLKEFDHRIANSSLAPEVPVEISEFEIELNHRSEANGGKAVLTVDRVRIRKSRMRLTAAVLAVASMLMIAVFVVVVRDAKWSNLSGSADPLPSRNESTMEDDENRQREIPPQSLPKSRIPELAQGAEIPLPQEANAQIVDESGPRLPEVRSADDQDGVATVFAHVVADEKSQWDTPVANQVGSGTYRLVKGSAVFQLDNGFRFMMFGPAEVQLHSLENLRFVAGKILVDASELASDSMTIATRDAELAKLNRVTLLADVDDNGTDIKLLRGDVDLELKNAVQTIALNDDGLKDAFVSRPTGVATESGVVVARGAKDKFFAQIGIGDQATQTSSSNEFDKLIERLGNGKANSMINDTNRARLIDIQGRLRAWQNRFEGGDASRIRESMEEMLPGMFDSFSPDSFLGPANFDEFRRKMEKQFSNRRNND